MAHSTTIERRWDPLRRPLAVLLLALASAVASGPAGALDLQGHRGARGLAPENTLPAFATALAIGVTTLEMDLGVSRDGVVVVAHDPELNPDFTRDAEGAWLAAPGPLLHELSVAEIQSYDVGRARPGSRYAERFADQQPVDGTRIPSLAQVVGLSRAGGNEVVRFNVETKSSPLAPEATLPPDAFATAVVAELRAEGIADRTTVQSFDWRTLDAVRASAPEIATACLTAEQNWLDNVERGRDGASPWLGGRDADDHSSVPALVAAAGCRVWSPFAGDLTPGDLAIAQDLGLEVIVWTVDDPARMAALIDQGVDGIITDRPDRLRRVMAERGLPLPDPTPVAP